MKVLSVLLYLIVTIKMARIILAEYSFTNTFTKVVCNKSGKTCVDHFCYITSDNKTFSHVSFGCKYNRQVFDRNLTLKVFYKYGDGFRHIIKGPTMIWSNIAKGKSMNPFFKILANLVKKTSPLEFETATPHDKFGIYNLSVENEKHFSMFPKGEYKFDFIYGDEKDDYIYAAKIYTLLTSSVKLDESK